MSNKSKKAKYMKKQSPQERLDELLKKPVKNPTRKEYDLMKTKIDQQIRQEEEKKARLTQEIDILHVDRGEVRNKNKYSGFEDEDQNRGNAVKEKKFELDQINSRIRKHHNDRQPDYAKQKKLRQKLRNFKSVKEIDAKIRTLEYAIEHADISPQKARQNHAEIKRLKSFRPDACEYERTQTELFEHAEKFNLNDLKKQREEAKGQWEDAKKNQSQLDVKRKEMKEEVQNITERINKKMADRDQCNENINKLKDKKKDLKIEFDQKRKKYQEYQSHLRDAQRAVHEQDLRLEHQKNLEEVQRKSTSNTGGPISATSNANTKGENDSKKSDDSSTNTTASNGKKVSKEETERRAKKAQAKKEQKQKKEQEMKEKQEKYENDLKAWEDHQKTKDPHQEEKEIIATLIVYCQNLLPTDQEDASSSQVMGGPAQASKNFKRFSSKKAEDFSMFGDAFDGKKTGKKKGKKGKSKSKAKYRKVSSQITHQLPIFEEFSKVGVSAPLKREDVAKTIQELKDRRDVLNKKFGGTVNINGTKTTEVENTETLPSEPEPIIEEPKDAETSEVNKTETDEVTTDVNPDAQTENM